MYLYKGKNWLEIGGATYIIGDYMGENRAKNVSDFVSIQNAFYINHFEPQFVILFFF